MKTIAAIYACHNRKAKTLRSLETLFGAYSIYSKNKIKLSVYLMDDGSTDGTSDLVSKSFPQVTILNGPGSYYWSEAMRSVWKKALQNDYDYYLLLNDDTKLYPSLFENLFETEAFSIKKYGRTGIYIGGTEDEKNGLLTYSGGKVRNVPFFSKKIIPPSGFPQICDVGTGNIMMVPRNVVEKIGIISKGYNHGFGDYDYTLKAKKQNIPVLIAPEILGHCEDDHQNPYNQLVSLNLRQRIAFAYSPNGLDLKSHLTFTKRFFPFRVPFVWINGMLKILSPKLYLRIKSLLTFSKKGKEEAIQPEFYFD